MRRERERDRARETSCVCVCVCERERERFEFHVHHLFLAHADGLDKKAVNFVLTFDLGRGTFDV